jgi:hypothetical protein
MKVRAPGRLWLVVIMDIVLNFLGMLVLLTGSVPAILGAVHTYNIVIGACVSTFLYISCVIALLGRHYGRQLMFVAVLVTYAINLFQSIRILYINFDVFDDHQHAMFYFAISKLVFELLLNIWALDSLKTRQFFAMKALSDKATS